MLPPSPRSPASAGRTIHRTCLHALLSDMALCLPLARASSFPRSGGSSRCRGRGSRECAPRDWRAFRGTTSAEARSRPSLALRGDERLVAPSLHLAKLRRRFPSVRKRTDSHARQQNVRRPRLHDDRRSARALGLRLDEQCGQAPGRLRALEGADLHPVGPAVRGGRGPAPPAPPGRAGCAHLDAARSAPARLPRRPRPHSPARPPLRAGRARPRSRPDRAGSAHPIARLHRPRGQVGLAAAAPTPSPSGPRAIPSASSRWAAWPA